MSKISILTKFIFFVAILVLSTFAKPTSPDESTNNDDKNPIINYWDIVKNCRSQFGKDKSHPENPEQSDNNGCFHSCIYEKMGFLKNNKIEIKKIADTLKSFENFAPTEEFGTESMSEILTKCANTSNSNHFEDKCKIMKDFQQCIKRENLIALKSRISEEP